MNQNEKTTNEKRDWTKVGLVVLATAGTIGTVSLGVLCYMKTKDNEQLVKINEELVKDKEILKVAYDELREQSTKALEDVALVKRVVGGPLINRLIKNEEVRLSRISNKIANISKNNLDEAAQAVLKEMMNDKQNSMETIKDFVEVRDTLK